MTSPRRPSPQTVAVLLGLPGPQAGWRHGYDLCRSLDLKAGTVYPILIRLAERGLVDTTWEQDAPHGRPPRHLYRLSPEGAAFAATLRADVAAPARSSIAARRTPRPASGAAGA